MKNTDMKVEQRLVSELIPYIRNSRTHSDEQVAQLAASIKEFGWMNPIIIDADGGLIAGHGRLMAAQKLKIEKVPCLVADHLTEAQRKAYVIADNKLALNAGWDADLLKIEIQELGGMDFNLDLLGFTQMEIDVLFADAGSEGLTDPDAVPEAPTVPASIRGDIWHLGGHRLMCGDSTDSGCVERLMDGVKADLIFTDPPYGVDYKGINNDSRDGLSALLAGAFSNLVLASKSGAAAYVFHSDRCADIFHEVFRRYFHFSSMIIWAKPSLVLSRTDYQSQHEPCLYGWVQNGSHAWYGDRKQTSIWSCGKEKVDGHTTPKPVELIERALNNSSKSGDVILDLFGGSGSTLIACEKVGRVSRLMELDPIYVDVIINRWQDFTGKEATHIGDGRTFNEIAAERLKTEA